MKKLKGNKNTLKIVAATSVCLFSLLTVFSAAFAWFSMNQQTNGDGMAINIGDKGGRLEYVYFHSFSSYTPEAKQNGVVTTPEYFKFNKNPFLTYKYDWAAGQVTLNDSATPAWDMGEYYYDDRNHPMLIVFAYRDDFRSTVAGDMYIQGSTTVGGNIEYAYADDDTEHTNPLYTTNGGFLGARDHNGSPYYKLPQTQVNDGNHPESLLMRNNVPGIDEYTGQPTTFDYYALSSVVDFKYRTFDNASYTTFKNGSSTLDFAGNTLTAGESFTTIVSGTDKYLFKQQPYLYKSDGSSTVKYIALMINYSPETIGYIYSTYLGDSGLDSYWGTLRFDCDWSFEVV